MRQATIKDTEKSSQMKVAPRLTQILRVLIRHKFLRPIIGIKHWSPQKEVREALEELGLVFLKFEAFSLSVSMRGFVTVADVPRMNAHSENGNNLYSW